MLYLKHRGMAVICGCNGKIMDLNLRKFARFVFLIKVDYEGYCLVECYAVQSDILLL
jgi:hypothetical protein